MEQYINKSALVAEIERRIKRFREEKDSVSIVKTNTYKGILSFIDTLEVKEVDLDFLLHEYWNLSSKITIDCLESATMTKDEMINFAKHFFELGVNASNPLTWEDVKLIWTIGDEIPYMPEEDFFKELLKRFKAQKGEKE